ncbi:uncharacterized protein [Nicotiana tomentosiformis]|uniref:uncharacterized protein n=1 Tax=Nicotiana tomentosiformis TaxID=4098 RepID=UPI00388CBAFF
MEPPVAQAEEQVPDIVEPVGPDQTPTVPVAMPGSVAGPKAVASDTVITGVVSVFHRDASMLFDPGSTYSYVSSYFSRYLDMPRDSLDIPIHASTPIGYSTIVNRVYRSCVVTIGSYETKVDLLLLSMVDFEVILGTDWLSPYHIILDCHTKTVTLAMSGLPRLVWRGLLGHTPSRVISYFKAQRIVEKGCLAYLSFVREVSVDTLTVESVPVVREF